MFLGGGDPAVGILEESADVWRSVWRNCFLGNRKKKKKPPLQSRFFLGLDGMQTGALGMLETAFIHAGQRPRMQSDEI